MSRALIDTLRNNLRLALTRGELSEAENILSRLKKEDPLSKETRGLELEFYLNSNRMSEAQSLADQLCVLFPDSSRILFLAGKLAYRQKRYESAVMRLRESNRVYPSRQTEYWLGKTLTQLGDFDEAESLLIPASEQMDHALLDLAWLYDRKNDLQAALSAYQQYLKHHPENHFAVEQSVRIKAKMLDPETLIEEMDALTGMGEETSDALFPEFVQRLFETGQTPRAREEVTGRLEKTDARMSVRLAWICYKAQAYDLACSLFLKHVDVNLTNFKLLNALETAATKASRIPQVLSAYRNLASQAPQLHGRSRTLARKLKKQ